MLIHRAIPLAVAALIAQGGASARADAGWSAAAHAGLAFTQHGGTVSSGGWIDLLHSVVPRASVGLEGGYLKLSPETYQYFEYPGFGDPTGRSSDMFSASGAVRIRGAGPGRIHVLGTFGYYDRITRIHFQDVPDQVESEWNPGFSLGIGFSGAGLVRPGFQLRWHETIGPDETNIDIVTFEVGLNFN